MQKNSITNKITPCCGLPFSVIYWWVSNLTLNSESDRQYLLTQISQRGVLSIDGWKVLINSGTLEADASLTKTEFLAWFDCGKQPKCEQLKLIVEGFKISNWSAFYDSVDALNLAIEELENKLKLKYNNVTEAEAVDIIQRIDQFTGENVNYRETTTWHDGSVMDDSKVDGVIFIKKGVKYYVRQYTGSINVKWFGAKGDNLTNDTEAFKKAHDYIKSSIPPNQLKPPILFVPRGNYIIENFEIDSTGFQMIGEGSKNTIFKFINSMGTAPAGFYFKNAVLDTSSPDHKFYKDIKIENIGCDPSTIPNGKSFIQIRNCYDFLVRGVDVDTDSFALVNKFALEISDNVFTGSVENCYLPKVNCNASIAWTITTITFINLRSMNVRLNKCLGMTFIQPVIQGNENEKFYINNCDTVTIMGGDMENGGIFLNFGTNNSNIRSFGNNILALSGAYSSGEIPQNSYFDDKGNIGIGKPNVNGMFGKQLIKGLASSVIQTLMSAGGFAYQVLGNEDGGTNNKFTYVASASNYRTWGKISDDLVTKTEFMRLTASGNLLVGTTEDVGAKLYVNGIIRQDVSIHISASSGTATALPAQPKGYYETNVNGETVRVPFY